MREYEKMLKRYGIESLDDPILIPAFVKAAKDFNDFAENPESQPEQIKKMEDELIKLFHDNHEVKEDQDGNEDEIVQKRMDARKMASIEDYQARIVELERINDENQRALNEYKTKEEENLKRIKEEDEKRVKDAEQQNEKQKALVDLILSKTDRNGKIEVSDLEDCGVNTGGQRVINIGDLELTKDGFFRRYKVARRR